VAGLANAVLVLALAATAVGATAARERRARRTAGHQPAPTPRPLPSALAYSSLVPDDLSARLQRLHDDHVERVNQAVSEGREDLAQELADEYMDTSLALITAVAPRSEDHFHIQ
jgi:hypothetical protein